MEKAFLEECLANELSLERIGSLTGKHPSTVSYWLQKHGLQPHGMKHAPKGGLQLAELEPLVEAGLTIEQIAQRLGVGDRTVCKWLKRHGLQTERAKRRASITALRDAAEPETWLRCPKHGLGRFVAVHSERRLRCAKCRSEAVARRRRKVKEMLVEEAGGQCVLCGYSRSSAALHFHHTQPSEKVFALGVRGMTRSIARLRAEASKCVLLCANCHAEVEAGISVLPVKSLKAKAVQASGFLAA